jgi:hypothetical protein
MLGWIINLDFAGSPAPTPPTIPLYRIRARDRGHRMIPRSRVFTVVPSRRG